MAQLFPKWLNRLPMYAALTGPLVGALAVGGVWYYGSPLYTDVGYTPVQPVPYSHALHAGEMGIDCRYCHVSVETSPVANIPPTPSKMSPPRMSRHLLITFIEAPLDVNGCRAEGG